MNLMTTVLNCVCIVILIFLVSQIRDELEALDKRIEQQERV